MGRVGVDGRLRRGPVDRERPARRSLDIRRVVHCADADRVAPVRREAAGREGVRPVAGGERGVVPELGSAGEAGAVPVVARALADGDLDLGHAGARAVRVGPAEAVRRAAGVPARRVVRSGGRREGDRGGRRRGVDEPGVGGRGAVGVAGDIRGADVEGVAAVGEARVALGGGAGAPGASVEAALEGGAALACEEGEARARGRRRVARVRVDRRLGSGAVDHERAARRSLDIPGNVGRAHARRVAAVGREASGGEAERPVTSRQGRRVPDLGGAREAGAVPVVAAALPDRDLDGLDAGAAVRVGAAEAVRGAARVPAGRVVRPVGCGERHRRGRRRVIDPERPRRAGLRVLGVVARAHVDGVLAVGWEARRRERERPVAARKPCGLVRLRPGRERAPVPVETARDAHDRDLDGLDASAGVGVRAAEPVRRAASVPGRVRVVAARGREAEERARVGRVVGEAAARRGLRVGDGVDGAHLHRVAPVGREAAGGERVRPAPGREARRVPDLARARESCTVPVVAAALADGDLHLRDARARAVRVGAAEAGCCAARRPPGGVVLAGGARERGSGAWRRRVDEPREGGWGAVGIASDVGRPHVEGVAAVGEARVVSRAGAGAPGAAVEAALEGRAALVRAEGEGGASRSGRVRRVGVDRRLRRGAVDRERPAARGLDVSGRVGSTDADRVAAVSGEARRRERVGPAPGGDRSRVPDLARAREGAAAPVVAGALADGDLHLRDARAAVGVGTAVADRAAAGVPARCVVGACGGGEGRGRRRRRVVDATVRDRGRVGHVSGRVGNDDAEVVEPVRDARRVERCRIGRGGIGADGRPRAGACGRALEDDGRDR